VVGVQSLSFATEQLAGQQPSPFVQLVITGCVHCDVQLPAEPTSTSFVHALPSLGHAVGQPAPSHVSGGSTTPLPHIGVQPSSFVALQPAGQQASPFAQLVIGGYEHVTLHCAELPERTFDVHTIPSSQLAGQLPSHTSGASMVPLPHIAEQLASLFALHCAGQQPSPPTHAVIAV
jgi:hypothetical protein